MFQSTIGDDHQSRQDEKRRGSADQHSAASDQAKFGNPQKLGERRTVKRQRRCDCCGDDADTDPC